jgi:hypothetical protein
VNKNLQICQFNQNNLTITRQRKLKNCGIIVLPNFASFHHCGFGRESKLFQSGVYLALLIEDDKIKKKIIISCRKGNIFKVLVKGNELKKRGGSCFAHNNTHNNNNNNNNNNNIPVMVSLAFQRRLAMSIFHCGWRKVWLDPNKKHIIAQARTRTNPFFVDF